MRRQIAAVAAAFTMLLTVGCSSDPNPAPAPASPPAQTVADSGSEVDRSSAESTALAFARMYAAGDLPHACDLANADGRKSLATDCDGPQNWSTTVTPAGQCQSGDDLAFRYEAPVGSINGNSDLIVWVHDDAGMWWVAAASTPASTASDPMACYTPTGSATTPSGITGSAIQTSTSG